MDMETDGGRDGSSPEKKAEMAKLLNRWAPVFKMWCVGGSEGNAQEE